MVLFLVISLILYKMSVLFFCLFHFFFFFFFFLFCYFFFFFFFFQAEDGIRDFHVTGVQTCALPIFTLASLAIGWIGEPAIAALVAPIFGWLPEPLFHLVAFALAFGAITYAHIEIGRASCRERV